MQGKARNRFLTLLAQKEQQLGRRLYYLEVAEATGLTIQTVSRWARNDISRIELPILETFCAYFDCDVGDLLYIEPETQS